MNRSLEDINLYTVFVSRVTQRALHLVLALQIPAHVALLLGLTLVVELLAACQADLELGEAPRIEIQLQRHQGQPLLLQLAAQAVQLLLVKQQLTRARRIAGVVHRRRLVRADITADQQHAAIADDAMRLGEVRLSCPDRLDLGARQHDAGLEGLEDMILMACTPVDDGHMRMLRARQAGVT